MVKLWGYTTSSGLEKRCPGGMFSTQTLTVRDPSSSLRSVKKVIMKLPRPYDVQRLVLARHLMYLRHPEVRYGKSQSPKDFEAKVEEFRRQRIEARVADRRRTRWCKEIRRKQAVAGLNNSKQCDRNRQLNNAKWDLEAMSFKNILPDVVKDMIKKYQDKKFLQTPSQVEEWERKNREEELQRQIWLPKVTADLKSDRVNEILANYRMISHNGTSIGMQPIYTIYLESAYYALKTHDWSLISKCLCGMVESYRRNKYMRQNGTFPSGLNSFWMLGFLTVINHFKDDVSKVEQFAKDVKVLLGGNPLWIASHLAVWLLQKGHFMAASRVIDEYSLEHVRTCHNYRKLSYNTAENPKRDMAIFFTQFIKSVHLYCIWKKELTMSRGIENEDVDSIDENALRRKGEAALGAFEVCYSKYKAIEGDAMCFLQPFVELVIEFRSVQRAREILEEVFNLNDGNIFVEEFYTDFLEEHYSDTGQEQDLIRFLKRRTQKKFYIAESDVKAEMKLGNRQIKQWKAAANMKGQAVSTMKQISKPDFSW